MCATSHDAPSGWPILSLRLASTIAWGVAGVRPSQRVRKPEQRPIASLRASAACPEKLDAAENDRRKKAPIAVLECLRESIGHFHRRFVAASQRAHLEKHFHLCRNYKGKQISRAKRPDHQIPPAAPLAQ